MQMESTMILCMILKDKMPKYNIASMSLFTVLPFLAFSTVVDWEKIAWLPQISLKIDIRYTASYPIEFSLSSNTAKIDLCNFTVNIAKDRSRGRQFQF